MPYPWAVLQSIDRGGGYGKDMMERWVGIAQSTCSPCTPRLLVGSSWFPELIMCPILILTSKCMALLTVLTLSSDIWAKSDQNSQSHERRHYSQITSKLQNLICATGISNVKTCSAGRNTGDTRLAVKFLLNGEHVTNACAPSGNGQCSNAVLSRVTKFQKRWKLALSPWLATWDNGKAYKHAPWVAYRRSKGWHYRQRDLLPAQETPVEPASRAKKAWINRKRSSN